MEVNKIIIIIIIIINLITNLNIYEGSPVRIKHHQPMFE